MAWAAKKEKEVSLETVLWNCRVALRGVGSTEKNRDAVIGLVFPDSEILHTRVQNLTWSHMRELIRLTNRL